MLKNLIEGIADTITDPRFTEVCKQYGDKMKVLYKAYKNGEEEEALDFLAAWVPWLLGTNVVTVDNLKALSVEDRRRLRILDREVMGEKNTMKEDGRWVIIGGSVRLTGSARAYAYDATVFLHDEATVHAYGSSSVIAKSGWVFAFDKSRVDFNGRGFAEMYDDSFITARGDIMVFAHEQSVVVSNLRVHLVDKREGKRNRLREYSES